MRLSYEVAATHKKFSLSKQTLCSNLDLQGGQQKPLRTPPKDYLRTTRRIQPKIVTFITADGRFLVAVCQVHTHGSEFSQY